MHVSHHRMRGMLDREDVAYLLDIGVDAASARPNRTDSPTWSSAVLEWCDHPALDCSSAPLHDTRPLLAGIVVTQH